MPLLLQLTYDGTDLSGCPEVPGRRTVVGAVRGALEHLGVPLEIEALSRTDAGVHARGQVVVMTPDRELAPEVWLRALRKHLPMDVRCGAVAAVPAVPEVVGKTYGYTLDTSVTGDPFLARQAWWLPGLGEGLEALAAHLVGTHDFEAFRRRGETREDLTRTITEAAWVVADGTARFQISGTGFTYRLVRSLVGAMVSVSRGTGSAAQFQAALAGEANPVAQQQAPARGLVLEAMALSPEPEWIVG